MSFPKYQARKDSCVEWIGEVPRHWAVQPFKRHARLLTEKTDRRDQPVALENIESWTGRFVPTETEFEGDGVAFESGDVLFGKLRPYLAKTLVAESAGEAVGDFLVMRPAKTAESRFLAYQLRSREVVSIIDGSTFGSKMPRASWDFVGSMPAPLPPVGEQVSIVAFLDRETAKIDALIEEQRRLIELLKEKRQAVISQAVTKGLNPNVPMKDSGMEWLGKVPAHWKSVRLKTLFRQEKRQGFPDKEVLSVYREFGVIPKDSRTDNFNKTPEDLTNYQLVRAGDLVVNKMKAWQGSLGISGLEGITSPDYVVFSPMHAEDSDYLHLLVRSRAMVSTYLSISNGIRLAQWRLEPEAFLAQRVFVPPADEQTTIADFVGRQMGQWDALMSEADRGIDLLQQRRSALISAAVTGKIDVRGLAPQPVGAAA